MLFIGVALLVGFGIVVILNTDAGNALGLSDGQLAQALPLVIILILLAGGIFARRRSLSELLGNLIAWGVIFGLVLVGYTYRADLTDVASRLVGELMPGVAVVDDQTGAVTFRAGRDGHFTVKTSINGHPISTIFDTGASAIVLSHKDAETAGIETAALSYHIPVATANGTGKAAEVTLDRVDVGGIVRNNVRAFVVEPGALDTSLLGMSFLRTLSQYAVKGSALELRD
jgi:aspartyl protease family protein